MDAQTMASLGKIGAATAISIAAIGSALGTGTSAMAAIGAWKKCYLQSKVAPFLLLIFIGAPLSQTIYGMILMGAMNRSCEVETYVPADMVSAARQSATEAESTDANWFRYVPEETQLRATNALETKTANWPFMVIAGVIGGLAMAMSAYYQGRAGAAGADALAETGQGFGNYLMAIGVVETVALFVLVFLQGGV